MSAKKIKSAVQFAYQDTFKTSPEYRKKMAGLSEAAKKSPETRAAVSQLKKDQFRYYEAFGHHPEIKGNRSVRREIK